jgi:hemoglobin-like flavoprotein
MNSVQVQLVQSTFKTIRPIETGTSELFHERLFCQYPSIRPMFKGDGVYQWMLFATMVNSAVRGLSDVESLRPLLQCIGHKFSRNGIRDEHYLWVWDALLWTLERKLAPNFTPDVREAWCAAYASVSGVVRETSCKSSLASALEI